MQSLLEGGSIAWIIVMCSLCVVDKACWAFCIHGFAFHAEDGRCEFSNQLCVDFPVVFAVVDELVSRVGGEVGDLDLEIDHVIHLAICAPLLWDTVDRNATKVGIDANKFLNTSCSPVSASTSLT